MDLQGNGPSGRRGDPNYVNIILSHAHSRQKEARLLNTGLVPPENSIHLLIANEICWSPCLITRGQVSLNIHSHQTQSIKHQGWEALHLQWLLLLRVAPPGMYRGAGLTAGWSPEFSPIPIQNISLANDKFGSSVWIMTLLMPHLKKKS